LSIRFQADAYLRYAIVIAVRQREPSIDFASSVESGLEGVTDSEILERAASDGRILVTHDRRTMLAHFRDRLKAGKPSPGIFVVSQGASLGQVVSAIVLAWSASEPSEWRGQVHHLPALTRHVSTR
jgi:hypothetical protein